MLLFFLRARAFSWLRFPLFLWLPCSSDVTLWSFVIWLVWSWGRLLTFIFFLLSVTPGKIWALNCSTRYFVSEFKGHTLYTRIIENSSVRISRYMNHSVGQLLNLFRRSERHRNLLRVHELGLIVSQPCLWAEKCERISVFRGAKLLTCPGRSHVSDRTWLDAGEYASFGDVREGGCGQVVVPWELPVRIRTPPPLLTKRKI
jgi:hypothetical protein